MPKKVVKYACSICGRVYNEEKDAIDCEKIPVEESICKVGDVVIIGHQSEKIEEIRVEFRKDYQKIHRLQYCYFDLLPMAAYEHEITIKKNK